MANVAAYSGLRWGEIAALTVPQADTTARVITVDRKVIEVAGHALYPACEHPSGHDQVGRAAAARPAAQ
jgi:hypothetical protein